MQEEDQPGLTSLNGWTVGDLKAKATVLNATITLKEQGAERVKATLTTKQGRQIDMTINVPVPKRLEDSDLVTEVCRRRRPVDILQVIMGHWTGADRQQPTPKGHRKTGT